MSFLIIYTVISVLSMSIYLFSKNYLSLKDLSDTLKFLKKSVLKSLNFFKHSHKPHNFVYSDAQVSRASKTLNKSLRHLEFISELEVYTEKSNECLLSTDCLHELEDSKLRAQISVLKSTSILNAVMQKNVA